MARRRIPAHGSRALRRLAFLLAMAVILPIFMIVAPLTLLCAAAAWLAGATEAQLDKILLNPVLCGLVDMPSGILGHADH